MAKSRDPSLDNKLFSGLLPVLSNKLTFLFLWKVCLGCSFKCLTFSGKTLQCMLALFRLSRHQANLCFKFAGSGKIHRIWKSLMLLKLLGFLLARLKYTSCFVQ